MDGFYLVLIFFSLILLRDMKTKITLKIFIFLILTSVFSSFYCEPGTTVTAIDVLCTNKSDETIYVKYSYDITDTSDTYDYSYLFIDNGAQSVIPSDSTKKVWGITTEMDGKYTGSNRILKFIVLKESTMKKYSREEIINQRIHDGWYEFTYSELEAMDYTWVYE